MGKSNRNSILSLLFIFSLFIMFGAEQSATAQDESAIEVDVLDLSVEVELITSSGVELINMSGPMKMYVYFEGQHEGDAQDDDGDGNDEVPTEIVSMSLTGMSPTLGQVHMSIGHSTPSIGQMTEQFNNTPGILDLAPFGSRGSADSFFDVFFEIEIPSTRQILVTDFPKRLTGVQTHKPAAPCDIFENKDQTPLFTADGDSTDYVLGSMKLQGICEECDWNVDDGHKMHWAQLPDLEITGMDVDMSELYFADDFRCTATGTIDDIHFWGSFRDDVLPPKGPDSLIFEITIYSDIPATENGWSMPGNALWSGIFHPGEYSVRRLENSPEGWYDPSKELYLPNNHKQAYQYNFCIKECPFIQKEGTIYWLSVRELRPDDAEYKFGWKTTPLELRWNDAAIFFFTEKLISFPMKYPKDHQYIGEAFDLAFVITHKEPGPDEHDLGDAPDSSNSFSGQIMLAYPNGVIGNFPTVYEIGSPPYGPIHWLPHAMFYLGDTVTSEIEADIGYDEDIKNNLVPMNDLSDLDGGDDSIRLTLVLPDCQRATFNYTVRGLTVDSSTAYLNVWFDWNRDGDWDDTMECPDGTIVPEWAVPNHQILVNTGINTLTTPEFMCWHPQTDAELDPTWMRITIGEIPLLKQADGPALVGGAGPAGGYDFGETEDYLIYPKREGESIEYDWGDAPTGTIAAGYPTLSVNNGARHVIAGPWFGGQPDSEPDGQPDTNALGDDSNVNDDEDGISIPILVPGQSEIISIEVNGGGGIVQAWIDFNKDMSWDASEKIYDGFLPTGSHSISISVPVSALTGQTFARFRISKQCGLTPVGSAPEGEVEDHEVFIESQPQATTRPISPTQCPAVLTECPTTVTTCPAGVTYCPPVRTQCPAAATTCPSVQTQCPATATTCPPVQTQCPAVETECPPTETRCPVVETECPPVETQCPAVETECPPVETRCPAIETECPPAETMCPPVETECPPIKTRCPSLSTTCPPIETQCPGGDTFCPVVMTRCPAAETKCPASETMCPSVETECPPVETRCPTVETKCPPAETMCPVVETECPPFETRCPAVETKCPPAETMCPAVETECPPVETMCPPEPTMCPPIETQCPGGVTNCPAVETQCPVVETKCPPAETKCPVVETECPVSETRCPPLETECPPAETQCPMVETECPPSETKCPVVITSCPPIVTRCPAVETSCPVVETECPAEPTRCPPAETQCPMIATECPPSETKCPVVITSCPPIVTRCPAMETSCPVVETECPSEPTRCPPVQTQCPAVETECPGAETKCPPVSTECPVVQTRCPPVETECPGAETKCPPVSTECPMDQTRCPPVETECPPSSTRCPPVDTECPPIRTRCPFSSTTCPPVETKCPPISTECPVDQTRCPPVETECPSAETKCPPVSTECPVVITRCPPTQTRCPVVDTQCPVSDTQCPVSKTICPLSETNCPIAVTKCPPTDTQCNVSETKCPPIDTRCPVVETECPPEPTQCSGQETSCPVETLCPALRTHCPVTPTQCPAVATKCPPVETQCPAVETQCDPTGQCAVVPENRDIVVDQKYSFVAAECPAIDVQCPTIVPQVILAKAP